MRSRTRMARLVLLLVLVVLAGGVSVASSLQAQEDEANGLEEWSLADDFSMSIDTHGFRFPTSIAFVPEPGPNADDPAYFVGEIEGSIKVVTNDRHIYTFAQDFSALPTSGGFNVIGGVGLGGLCLDPEHGFIFATLTAPDADGVFHNYIVRFETKPGSFDRQPSGFSDISGLVSTYAVFPNHQIGDCRVADGYLYVGVGDATLSATSRNPRQLLGKVLRLTLDGKPAPDNPFYNPQDPNAAEGAIYALGLRNPFGIEVAGGRVFAADNGNEIDRLVDVQAGRDYLWDGTDWGIGAAANAILAPAAGVTHLAFASPATSFLPDAFDDTFFVGSSGENGKPTAIIGIPYDFAAEAPRAVPVNFVVYRPESWQYVVALAIGPDGIYFAPLLPGSTGDSAVYKVTFDAASVNDLAPDLPSASLNAAQLLQQKGCLRCHSMNARETKGGPPLDARVLMASIQERLDSPEYRLELAQLDQRQDEPYASYRQARAEVLAASGEERVKRWIAFRLLEPRFDNMRAMMPNLNLTAAEAATLADYLVQPHPISARLVMFNLLEQMVPKLRYRHLPIVFAAGLLSGLLLTLIGVAVYVGWRRRPGGNHVS